MPNEESYLRSISDVLATVIMTGVLIGLLTITLAYSYLVGYQNTYKAEYLYYRQFMLSLATNIYYVLNGGEYTVTYPSSTMSLGYRVAGFIRVYVNSSSNPSADIPCYTISAASYLLPSAGSTYIYGGLNPVVNDTRFIPSVREFYENNSARIELDTCRVYAGVQATFDRLGSFYYFNLMVVSLNPVLSPGGGFAEVYSSSSTQSFFSNVYNLTIVLKNPASPATLVLGPRDIYSQYTGGPVTVSLTVINVTVVIH